MWKLRQREVIHIESLLAASKCRLKARRGMVLSLFKLNGARVLVTMKGNLTVLQTGRLGRGVAESRNEAENKACATVSVIFS